MDVDDTRTAHPSDARAANAGVAAGDGLLDPAAIAALVVLVLNDHVLKQRAADTPWALVTGKLSDVAGVLFLPVLVVAGVEVLASLARRYRGPSTGMAAVVATVVAVAFALMKTWPAAASAYREALGALQWPYFAVVAAVRGLPVPAVVPVRHVMDATDLVALPAALWAVVQTRARARSWATSGATNRSNDDR